MTDSQEFARGYASGNDMQHDAGVFLIDRLKIAPGMHVLDVGCGPGGLTGIIADLVGQQGKVVGIDPSPERISLARERSTPQLTFHEGQAEDLSRFPAASFDIIFVNSTFHWVRDQPLAMREFARALKQGGRLGISGGSGDFEGTHTAVVMEVMSREPYRQYPRPSDPRYPGKKDLERLLADAGFNSRNLLERTVVKTSKDPESMVQWMETSTSGKLYGSLPSTLKTTAREDIKEEWLKHTTDDGIKLELHVLVTVASKGEQVSQ